MCLKQLNIILIIYIIGSIFIFDSCSSADVAQVPALSFIAGTSGGEGVLSTTGPGSFAGGGKPPPSSQQFFGSCQTIHFREIPSKCQIRVRFICKNEIRQIIGILSANRRHFLRTYVRFPWYNGIVKSNVRAVGVQPAVFVFSGLVN